jgi:hypothetical protein
VIYKAGVLLTNEGEGGPVDLGQSIFNSTRYERGSFLFRVNNSSVLR